MVTSWRLLEARKLRAEAKLFRETARILSLRTEAEAMRRAAEMLEAQAAALERAAENESHDTMD